MSNRYEITVKGHIDGRYFSWLPSMTVTHTHAGETIMALTLRDQAELHGLLAQIRDLSLPLLALKTNEKESDDA